MVMAGTATAVGRERGSGASAPWDAPLGRGTAFGEGELFGLVGLAWFFGLVRSAWLVGLFFGLVGLVGLFGEGTACAGGAAFGEGALAGGGALSGGASGFT
ncbi:hypothetical protein ACFQ9J_13260 [Streptomyces sp. NPDC056529]|uniref:hypothetical protein n=1 Tax=Streptomyces sp. NPDC056529 TaxID=3345855 RepID=UPI0036A2BB83